MSFSIEGTAQKLAEISKITGKPIKILEDAIKVAQEVWGQLRTREAEEHKLACEQNLIEFVESAWSSIDPQNINGHGE